MNSLNDRGTFIAWRGHDCGMRGALLFEPKIIQETPLQDILENYTNVLDKNV